MYTLKILTDLCFKKRFCKSCLQFFSSENILIKHKENCLSLNVEVKSVKIEEGIIKFENYFRQIPVPFKIYADFKCNLKKVKCKVLIQKNIKTIFLVVFLIKLFVLMINLLNQLLYIEVKMELMNLLKQFLKNMNIAKK